ncbi:hypothetical protein QBA38_07715 [Streptomyces stelliscabiei]|uniref:hypothetical protein n=1 Tax=Streptomyces stelliscabiei TaxID=146820 RepID=UPI002FF379DB
MTATTAAATVQGGSQWVQTGPINHPLTTTAERISEVPELTIPFPGVWELTYHVRTSFSSGNQRALWIHTWLDKDGVRIEGSEARTAARARIPKRFRTRSDRRSWSLSRSGRR